MDNKTKSSNEFLREINISEVSVFDIIEEGKHCRKHLHTIPELGRVEYKTREYCIEKLKAWGFRITNCFETGFYADFEIPNKSSIHAERIAFRADMDALPAHDATETEYKSEHPGVSHNCGHDLHMATLLTLAYFIYNNPSIIRKNVRLIFQPSEEMFVGGAKGMIDNGCLEDVSFVYGLHNNPEMKVGEVGIRKGTMSSNGTQFHIDIKGKSTHGSTPHLGMDTISEGVRIVNGFKSIIADRTDPNKMALLTVCEFKSGTAPNIISDFAYISGSFRSFDNEIQNTIETNFDILMKESVARGFDTTYKLKKYPSIVNHKECVDRIKSVIGFVNKYHADVDDNFTNINGLDSIKMVDIEPMKGSEDFSYYLQYKPGAFFFLGSGNNHYRTPLHSNPFYVDDEALVVSTTIYMGLLTNSCFISN